MIDKYYRFVDSNNFTRYFFESEDIQGKVIKIVQFSANENDYWNLGFGDWQKGKIDDNIITNNFDVAKVMRTIGRIVYVFFEHYPKRIIYI
jgi:hypothetical protein